MPPPPPPRPEWDLLSNTRKTTHAPPKFVVPVEEENPIGVATTGLKQLGGVIKYVPESESNPNLYFFSPHAS
jgi:hypothetical protein